MNGAAFSDEEIAAVKEKHPRLERTGPGTVEGDIELRAIYEGEEITDCFRVRIEKTSPVSERVPALFEIGGRTEAIAAKWKVTNTRDLHRDPDGSACVCVRQEEREKFPPGSDLLFFLERLARDYLYGMAFYERHGRWPWGERSHGSLGLLEFYADNTASQTREAIMEVIPSFRNEPNWRDYDQQIRKPSGRKACLCGSGRPFVECHPTAWFGLLRLHGELNRIGIKKRGLLDAARAQKLVV